MSEHTEEHIIARMWATGDIKCSPEHRDFIMMCLGITKYAGTSPAMKNGAGTKVDSRVMINYIVDGFSVVVKPPQYFIDNNVTPFPGILLVMDDKKRLLCMEDTMKLLQNACYSLKVDLVPDRVVPDTYHFVPKS